jgi:phenylpropionate dioxygenase-like ring-hydroxylating dioxygenase large terminal subunit
MEDHGLVWGCLGSAPADRPRLPKLPSRRLLFGPFDVAVSAPRAVENFLDTAHFAFVHEGGWVSYRHEVLGPYSALLSKQPEDGSPGDSFTLWTCPLDHEHSRVWMGQYTADTESTDEQLRAFQLAIFAQDTPVLESQMPRRLPISGGELHCAAMPSSLGARHSGSRSRWALTQHHCRGQDRKAASAVRASGRLAMPSKVDSVTRLAT